MISPETRALIRRYFCAEHWKIGTIASELRVHPDAVRNAIESERFRSTAPVRSSPPSLKLGALAARLWRGNGYRNLAPESSTQAYRVRFIENFPLQCSGDRRLMRATTGRRQRSCVEGLLP
jgi:hypothetical protein